MKNKIISFILGFLIGAIIATLGFYIYEKSTSNQNDGMPDGNMPQMMQQGGNGQQNNGNGGTPPEKPSGEQGNQQGGTQNQ